MKSLALDKYLKAEIREITLLKATESRKLGSEISRNAAALMWIEHHADEFRQAWLRNNGTEASSS